MRNLHFKLKKWDLVCKPMHILIFKRLWTSSWPKTVNHLSCQDTCENTLFWISEKILHKGHRYGPSSQWSKFHSRIQWGFERAVLNSISMYDLERKRGINEVTSSQGCRGIQSSQAQLWGKAGSKLMLQSCRGITQHGDNGRQILVSVTAKKCTSEKPKTLNNI